MARLQREKRSSAPHPSAGARHSVSSQPRMKAVRLTPAEIRAQNNGSLMRPQSQFVSEQSTKQPSDAHVTPPPSPTKDQSAYQSQVARTASQGHGPPTPPRSPRLSNVKRASRRNNALPIVQPKVSNYRQSTPIEAYPGIIGAPAPSFSRTSSISGSIMAPMKYRGHEITRTGSLSMFQAPPPDIVMNPLSNFSRPRNKYSPPGSFNRQDSNEQSIQPQHRRSDIVENAISVLPSSNATPAKTSDSAVSARSLGNRAGRKFVIVDEDSLPKDEKKKELVKELVTEAPAETFPAIRPMNGRGPSRDMKRASINFAKAVDTAAEKEAKKKRRHSFSWKRISGMDLKTDPKDDLEAPKEEPVATEVEKPRPKRVGQPGAVQVTQPVSAQATEPTVEDKGKGKIVAHGHAPVTGVKCCEKCGRIKKLQEGRALLNDGKTKETLVIAGPSSYKLVVDSKPPGSNAVNPAGAANAAQLTMHRQRRPNPEPSAALPGDDVVKDFAASPTPAFLSDTTKMIQPTQAEQTLQAPPRIVRFASLHGISQEKNTAPLAPALNTNLDSNTAENIPQMKATSTPVDVPLPEFVYDPADEEEVSMAPAPPERYSFESQRSVFNVVLPAQPVETQQPPPEVMRKAPESIDWSKPITLPEPNLGLHFSRSSLTLRGLMIPKGGSSSNLMEDMTSAAGDTDQIETDIERSRQIEQARRNHESRVTEIMAV